MPQGNPNRQLSQSQQATVLTNLAVGTHVFLVRAGSLTGPTNHIHVMVESTGGTVAITYTFDPGRIDDLATGVAPLQTFVAGVNQQVGQIASASAVVRLNGPVTAIEITVAGTAVNKVTVAM